MFQRLLATVSTLTIVWVIGVVVGCSAPDPYNYPRFEDLKVLPPQPFAVRVRVEQRLDESHYPAGAVTPALLDRDTRRAEIETRLAESLREHRAFARVLTSSEPAAADADVEIVVDISSVPTNGETFQSQPNGNKWWNAFVWLLGPPSWIAADRDFDPSVEIRYSLIRLGAKGASVEGGAPSGEILVPRRIDLADSRSLNFVRRWTWAQVAMNLVVPTPFVPTDAGAANESLFENFVSRIQREIGQTVKEESQLRQLQSHRAYPYLQAFRGDDGLIVVLLSDYQVDVDQPLRLRATESERELDVEWLDLVRLDAASPLARRIEDDGDLGTAVRNSSYLFAQYAILPASSGDFQLSPSFIGERGQQFAWSWTIDPESLETLANGSNASSVARR
jgi:hypothetical protein